GRAARGARAVRDRRMAGGRGTCRASPRGQYRWQPGSHQKSGSGAARAEFVRLLAAMSDAGTVTDPAGAGRRDRLLLTLTFAAGSVDALSYLGLSRVFTANRTGNAVLPGLAISQTQELQVAHSSAAIVGFVLGVILGARLVGSSRERIIWSSRISAAVGVECALLLVFAFG